MADDKTNRSGRDSATVSGGEPYEVDYFATKHGISQDEARALIDRIGNNRKALDAAASATKSPAAAKRASARRSTTKPGPRKSVKPREKTSTSTVKKLIGDFGSAVTAAEDTLSKDVIRPAVRASAKAGRKIDTVRRAATKTMREGSSSARDNITRTSKSVRRTAKGAVDTAVAAATGKTASVVGIAAAGLVAGLAANFGRKLLVQAPSTLAGDWLAALKAEHKLALTLFDKIQRTSDNQSSQRSLLLTQLKHALGKHAFTEENVIYPALRAWGDKADADKLNHDHGYVKQYLYDLEALDKASPTFLPMVADFRAALETHIREEEDAIFPPLHAGLGQAGNAKLTAQANKEGFKLA
ncbi:MAG: hemerythrin domain-containing protein [Pseudomonadota bacterium]